MRLFLKKHHSKLVTGAFATSALSLALALTGTPAVAADEFEEPYVDDGLIQVVDYAEYMPEPLAPELIETAEAAGAPLFENLPVGGGLSQRVPEPVWEALPWNIDRGPNWTDRVLLTYDDCVANPEKFIQVLDHAAALNIGLLLFPTGNCVTMFQNHFGIDLPAAIRDRGHWLGNHTITHPYLTRVSRAEIARQLSFPESNLVRPPFGDWNHTVYDVAAEMGMRIVMWDLDTNDWRGKSETEIIDFIVTYAEPGDNVLMHFQHRGFSVNALTEIQNGLRARGIELCRPAQPHQRPTPTQIPENIC